MKHLVMLGAGHAHVHMLSTLAAQPLAGVQITLVAPYPRQLYSGMLPGFVAGHYTLEDCAIDLPPLLAQSGVEWLMRSAVALDAQARTVLLDDGSTVPFDTLSVNSGSVQSRQRIEALMPGAKKHALFVRPIESFGCFWPQVVTLAQSRALRIAVIGGGAAGMELACAVAHRLGNSSVTLLSGDEPVGANYPAAVQVRMQLALKRRNITVLQTRATGISATEITLSSGAQLACDVPILAIGAQAPGWLQGSGLALDEDGFITVDAFQRSTSHANVFACGDICTRLDRNLPRSGVYAVRAGPPLTKNLRAVLAGIEPSAYAPQHKSLNLLSCGNQYAIASWGSWSTEGKWVWKIKNHIDRGFVHRYSRSPV